MIYMKKEILVIFILSIFLFCIKVNASTFENSFSMQENFSFNKSLLFENNQTMSNSIRETVIIGKIGRSIDNKLNDPNLDFGNGYTTCGSILGKNLTALVRVGIKAMQIIGAIVAIVNGMITLIPAVMSKDADGLKKAEKKLVLMAIILLCIFLLPYIVNWLGMIFDYDTSCFF